jgi:hypothetical protein
LRGRRKLPPDNIEGAGSVRLEDIRAILGVEEGRPLNLFAFSEGVDAVKSLYRSKGHLGMGITNEGTDRVIRYSRENRFADILLEVSEGPLYRASRITIWEDREFKELLREDAAAVDLPKWSLSDHVSFILRDYFGLWEKPYRPKKRKP